MVSINGVNEKFYRSHSLSILAELFTGRLTWISPATAQRVLIEKYLNR